MSQLNEKRYTQCYDDRFIVIGRTRRRRRRRKRSYPRTVSLINEDRKKEKRYRPFGLSFSALKFCFFLFDLWNPCWKRAKLNGRLIFSSRLIWSIMGEKKEQETTLHHRRRFFVTKNQLENSSKNKIVRPSIFQRFLSFFTYETADKIDIDEKKSKNHQTTKKSSCSCCQLCCKLILVFSIFYLIMFLRPDYSIFIRNSFENFLKKYNLTSEEYRLRPGQRLASYRQPSMPIIIIPGIISTGLELWQGEKCADGRFRHRFWTSMQMVDNIGRDHQCWLKHISLNLSTW